MVEYEEGIFKQDLATVMGEIKLAESDVSRADDRVEWSQRMYKKGYVSLATRNSELLALQKARFALEQAQTKKKVLEDFTRGKTVKELKSEVEKARSDELAKKATWTLEVTKEKKLERQIAACKLTAPSDGLVVYANDPTRSFMSGTPQVEEGAEVRERQKIFSLPDITKMQVNTKVHESHINKVKVGMRAKIRVDAYSSGPARRDGDGSPLLPDTASMFSSDVKVYTTKVRIDSVMPGLRPGMNAEVTIEVNKLNKVLIVPVMALLQFSGKDHLTRKVDGRFVQTVVELGASNEKFVEVTKGAKEGEIVAMSPISLMTELEKREAFGSTGKAALRDWSKEETADAAAKAGAAAAAVPGQVAVASKGQQSQARARLPGRLRARPGARVPACRPGWPNSPPRKKCSCSGGPRKKRKRSTRQRAECPTSRPNKPCNRRPRGCGNMGGGRGPGGGGFGGGRGRPGGGDGGSDQ